MSTQFEIDCALMAGFSYISSRPNKINQFSVPDGWVKVINPDSYYIDPATGFEAISFTNGSEIVISYAGTNPDDVWNDIVKTDFAAGLGLPTQQLFQAAEYYMQVRAANPGAQITFTGHSLGGGLASLMGIFFNETAVTFDQAPFRNCASALIALQLETYLTAIFPASAYPQIANWLDPIHKFILSFDPFGLGWSQDGLAAREAKVTGYNTQGEFLSVPYPLPVYRIGTSTPLTHGTHDFSLQVALHSQALLTAFLKSNDFKDVTFKLPDLIRLIFDDKMYNWDTKSSNENFIDRLVRHEFGNTPDGIQADAMLTRFTTDLWKIAQDGGLTLSDIRLSDALTAFAMQKYYTEKTDGLGAGETLFEDVSGGGGIQFDTVAVVGEGKSIVGAKGYSYFMNFLESYYTTVETDGIGGMYPETSPDKDLILGALSGLRDWYIQAGDTAMNATDTKNNGAFIPHSPSLAEDKILFEVFGGSGNDSLIGGTVNDFLVGNTVVLLMDKAANDSSYITWRAA